MHPKILIVGTVPYNEKSTSRAFDAYFHYWEKENLRQIFSNTKTPCKGHCGKLYQITDRRILKRWFNPDIKTGKEFFYHDLPDSWEENSLELENKALEKAYKLGSKHTPLTHLLRGILWRKKFWCTEELENWVEKFKPECIFLAFSNDYFIPQIALYFAKKYEIPIVSCIGDDYYFNKHFSLNPLYQIYKETYKRLIRKVLDHKGSAIYISNKIRDKYNSEFGLNGETVYLTSTVKRKAFSEINTNNPLITYFGNIKMGRNHSLVEIANALVEINPEFRIEVYSNELVENNYKEIQNNPNAVYGGSIPYQQVKEKMEKSDITVIVEGFDEKDIELSRYSLSTKAADALASGCAILVYGSKECGVIEYMQSTNSAAVCTEKKDLKHIVEQLIYDTEMQRKYYDNAVMMTEKNHTLESSTEIFESIVKKVIKKYD